MNETTLALLGFGMVATFIVLIMTKRLSPQVALTVIPILFGLIAGVSTELGQMMVDGVKAIAPTGVMLIFGILFFGVMIDARLFEPLVTKILQLAKGDPFKIIIGTAILTLFVSFDGDGAVTYLIVVSAMLPIYKRLKINPLILPAIIMLSVGAMHLLPWAGPSARVMSALKLDAPTIFAQIVWSMIAAIIWVLFVAWYIGMKEQKRLGISDLQIDFSFKKTLPKMFFVNLVLTLSTLVILITNTLPVVITFMMAFAFALVLNYPKLDDQRKCIAAHAGNALSVGSLVFAAGIFTGILSGTKMLDAMGQSFIHIIPDSLGPNLPVITALTSMPFTFFISNDAYYFGIIPITVKAASHFNISATTIGGAALLGQPVHLLSPLVASTYLLVGLAEVDFGDHQRFTLKWAIGTVLIMTVASVLSGVIQIHL